jgi:hypothetical protein
MGKDAGFCQWREAGTQRLIGFYPGHVADSITLKEKSSRKGMAFLFAKEGKCYYSNCIVVPSLTDVL